MNASRKEDLYTQITELNIREDQNALAYKLGVRFNSQEGGRRKGQTGYDYTNFALNLWDYESNVNRIVREKMTHNEVPVDQKLHAILDQLYEKKMKYGELGFGKRG